jgi:hypothetical protein
MAVNVSVVGASKIAAEEKAFDPASEAGIR